MIRPTDLISPAYLQTQVILHASPRGYGGNGDRWANTVLSVAADYDCGSVLDYGCGQGSLARALRGSTLAVREYDPAIPAKSAMPSFADLVNCTDVLEHIEPDRLDAVLAHIRGLARKVAVLVIATRPANKRLPDGSNAHLIIEPDAWWRARLEAAGFTIQGPPRVGPVKKPGKAYAVVVTP